MNEDGVGGARGLKRVEYGGTVRAEEAVGPIVTIAGDMWTHTEAQNILHNFKLKECQHGPKVQWAPQKIPRPVEAMRKMACSVYLSAEHPLHATRKPRLPHLLDKCE